MLTRLKVSGFKNLVDVDMRFGPFTCIAGANGMHLAATLQRLARQSGDPDRIYVTVANRLSELVQDVRAIMVDQDDKRELFVLRMMDRSGTWHDARSLSDGTLRFQALEVELQDVLARNGWAAPAE